MNKITYILVESPSKQKIFSYVASKIFEKNQYMVISTKGHIYKSKPCLVPYDVNFAINWIQCSHAKNIVKSILDKSGNNKCNVILATDPDREGELISSHIVDLLSKNKINFDSFRVCCSELNYKNIYKSINSSILHSTKFNQSIVDACLTRIKLDMIIGFNGSSILWQKLYGCASIGRVQSICLLKIKEREDEIRKFRYDIKYRIKSVVKFNLDVYSTYKVFFSQKEVCFNSKDECDDYVKKISSNRFFVKTINTKTVVVNNNINPMSTVDMLSVMSSNMFSVGESTKIAQDLYEGVDIGDEIEGLITYNRTDSNYISQQFVEIIKNYIHKTYGGNEFINKDVERSKNTNQQEAHEAIRLTRLDIDFNSLNISKRHIKFLNLVKYYTIAPFMQNGIDFIDNIVIVSDNQDIEIHLSIKSNYKHGYRKEDPNFIFKIRKDIENMLNKYIDVTFETNEYINKPPQRYSEITIIKEMRRMGIGRPSTYRSIVNTIKNRNYVYMHDNKFILSPIGYILCIFIDLYMFPIINYKFTYNMECMLDDISNNLKSHKEGLLNFINSFVDTSNAFKDESRQNIINSICDKFKSQYGSKCYTCGSTYNMYFYKSKPFLSCTNRHIVGLNEYAYNEKDMIVKMYSSKTNKVFKKTYKRNKNYNLNKK